MLTEYLAKRKNQSDWLFPNSAGTIFDDRNLIRREVEPVCLRLGIPRFSWHALRHTFTTTGENHGVPVSVMQLLLGHTSPSTTMIYAHAQDDAKRAALEKLSGVLFPSVRNPMETARPASKLVQ